MAALDGDWRGATCFDEREKAVIDWAEHVSLNTARRNLPVFERLRSFFDEPEVVELTVAIAHRNMVTRIQEALETDLEGDELPARTNITITPERLQRYVREVLSRTDPGA